MLPSKTVTVSDLKTHATALVARVSRTGGALIITRRGKPVARLVPFQATGKPVPGRMRGSVIFEHDIVSPTGAEWEANR